MLARKDILAGWRLTLWAGGAAVLAVLLMITLGSADPGAGFSAFFIKPWASPYALGNLLDNAAITALCALGFASARQAGLFNLGGEGLVYSGAVVSAVLGLGLGGLGLAGMLLMVVAAFLTGCLAGGAAFFMKTRLDIQEIISTYLLSLALVALCDSGLTGPLRNPAGNLLSTPPLGQDLVLGSILPPSTMNLGVFLVPLIALASWYIHKKSRYGYELRVLKANQELALSQGIPIKRHMLASLMVSCGLSSLAGSMLVIGSHHAAFAGISGNAGWNGITAAMLARDHPLGALGAALFVAWLQAGLRSSMIHSDLGTYNATLIQGLVILIIALGMTRQKRSS